MIENKIVADSRKTLLINNLNIFLIIFIICFVYSFWALSAGWNNTILDQHGFRQTQTAISTYYIIQGSSWLNYETPLLGVPWSIPFEFPLYQWIVAILVKIFHTPLDQTGRFVSATFFYLSLIPSYLILGHLNVQKHYRWMFLSLLLASPLYLFWSRTFMIESTAFFFALAYLAAVGSYFNQKTPKSLVLATLFGVLGALVKITTFAGCALAAGLFILFNCLKSRKGISDILYTLVIPVVAFALIPYIAVSSWTHFADSQKLLNPIAADFITSKSLTSWNFGTLEQKLSLKLWTDTLGRIFNDIWGNNKFIVVLLLLLPFFGKRKKLYLASILVFFAVLLTFTNLHFIHNYYQYANGIFLITSIGFCLLGILERRGIWKFIGCGFFALILIFQTTAYHAHWFRIAKLTNNSIIETAATIQKYTNPNDVLLIYGLDWSSELPYYSQRRALMDARTGMALPDEPKMKIALDNLSQYRLGAMVFCNDKKSDAEGIARLTAAYKFQLDSVSSNSLCEVHLPPAD